MTSRMEAMRALAEQFGQQQVFRFWESLTDDERELLLADLEQVDFRLMEELANTWVRRTPLQESFSHITPVPVLPPLSQGGAAAKEAIAAGEQALRAGEVGVFVVAGGQGTRLGFNGPKGSYPIGPITGKSLFAYHAEKILNLQRRYKTELPWYVMVSPANAEATRSYFKAQQYFDLSPQNVLFMEQRMVPCVDMDGRIILETPCQPAKSPDGHGGSIQALMDGGAIADAEQRGIKLLSYFQVDNWAVKVADPGFIGYHVLRNAAMSSKCHRRNDPREAVGVHCLCDGIYRVIEYSELDLYPQLLETDAHGEPVYYAGNPAIHILSVDFVRSLYDHFDGFPWHAAHKKIPYVDETGKIVAPAAPNGYKFETFVFDALRFTSHPPVALEIGRSGEYTPTKQYEGVNSVTSARQSMADFWAIWLEAAGCAVPRNPQGETMVPIEISPAYALTQEEFLSRTPHLPKSLSSGISIDARGIMTIS